MHTVLNIFLTILVLVVSIIILPFRLVIFLVRKLLGKPSQPRPVPRSVPRSELGDLEATAQVDGEEATLSVNLDALNRDGQEEFMETALDQADFELFEGRLKHGYDLKEVSDKDICPRCQSATLQMYSNFVYATTIAPRVMFAPAGYFCQKCPTVIIDQDLIRTGISRKLKFRGVLGIDPERGEDFEGFETWNGKKSVYLIDEQEGDMVTLTTADHVPEGYVSTQTLYDSKQYFKKKREKARKRRKLAKQTRKNKRRKK